MEAHVLIVDDEPDIRQVLERYLTNVSNEQYPDEGYRVSTAENGEEARQIMANSQVDLVILDVTLPGESGLEIAQALRADSDVGILMLTAHDTPGDRILGLRAGSDDYLGKPFDFGELLERVRSVLRRRKRQPDVHNVKESGVAIFARWCLDFGAHELTSPDGRRVTLTNSEYKLLAAFVRNAKRVLERKQLYKFIADRHWTPDNRRVDNLVAALRQKIDPMMIRTIRSGGYMFTADVELR